MIKFTNVVKTYPLRGRRNIILDNLTMELPWKSIGILGANGAGKSTFLRIAAGTEPPDSGHVQRFARISWPLGLAGGFNGSLTGAENVRFVARIYGQDTEYIIDYVIEFSELGEYFHMPVRHYSSGMRARLAFGVSMAINFDCYLIDEITAVGDARFKKRCRETFRDKLSNANVLMVSHTSRTLRQYCEMGGVLDNGKLVLFDDLEEAIAVHEEIMAR